MCQITHNPLSSGLYKLDYGADIYHTATIRYKDGLPCVKETLLGSIDTNEQHIKWLWMHAGGITHIMWGINKYNSVHLGISKEVSLEAISIKFGRASAQALKLKGSRLWVLHCIAPVLLGCTTQGFKTICACKTMSWLSVFCGIRASPISRYSAAKRSQSKGVKLSSSARCSGAKFGM